MRKYGLPFMGSKDRLAENIIKLLPSCAHLYDLFAGGCAITHCALKSGKWKKVHFNDLTDSVELFMDCLKGNVPDVSEWVSREDFYKRKYTDAYVRIVWSFAYNQRNYIYSRKSEPFKKKIHEMIFAKTAEARRLKFQEICRLIPSIELNRACSLESLERVRCFQNISNLHTDTEFEMSMKDYREIEILPDSVIICDPPYRGVSGYNERVFDHNAFYEWAIKQTQPVFICEYSMPSDFECVAEWERTGHMSATNNSQKVVERLFRPKSQL